MTSSVPSFFVAAADKALPVHLIAADEVDKWLTAQTEDARNWLQATGFKGQAGRVVLLPGTDGTPRGAVLGIGDRTDPFVTGVLPEALPEGDFELQAGSGVNLEQALLGWALGTYRFTRYKTASAPRQQLVVADGALRERVERFARAMFLARDLINTPANDMGPAELEQAVHDLGARFGAEVRSVVGEKLLSENYPLIHTVGRASDRAPRLVDLTWGAPDAPKVTLVGKGVCFDTGGLNLKPGSAMALMKKDMGGAANALALASLVMEARLPVRLRLLVGAVDNNVSGNAFRPQDVLPSRKGLTVEISNTDAEGRLVLADALAEADTEAPELLIDFATLTGAARVATGPEIVPFFTDDDALAQELARFGEEVSDPLWRLPLWQPYAGWLDSKIADINHASDSPFAGASTAALFLKRFVEKAAAYAHFDMYAWNAKPRPGRPVGGEAQAIRAVFSLIEKRWPAS